MALTGKQERVIPIIIANDSTEAAARAAGMSKNTLYLWQQQPEFNEAVSSARKKLLEKAMHRLMSISMKAVLTLESLLGAESESVRRAAANDILSHLVKHRELEEIEERLLSVEKIIFERKVFKP